MMILMGQMSKIFGEETVQQIMDKKIQRLINRLREVDDGWTY